jgi:long-chain acyl-CoA synthetase
MPSRFFAAQTITETFRERVKRTPDDLAFRHKPRGEATWRETTFRQFHDECRLAAYGLLNLGVRPGDRVALACETRYEWPLLDMAVLGSRAVTVPIYPSLPGRELVQVLQHSEAKVAVLEDARQLTRIFEARAARPDCLPHLRKIIVLDPAAMPIAARHPFGAEHVLTFQALSELGRRELARPAAPGTEPTSPVSPAPTSVDDRFDRGLAEARPEDLFTLCYTSGTTGAPKGVMLTHDAMISVLEDCIAALGPSIEGVRNSTLTFLPYAHILGRVESYCVYAFGWTASFAEGIDQLAANLREVRPTIFFCVPRFFEKAYAKIHQRLAELPEPRRRLGDWALQSGELYFTPLRQGKKPNLLATTQYRLARALVFSRIQDEFGGRLRYAICGGAPLPKRIGEFFEVIGLPIEEGYGLTETCGPITVNVPGSNRFGTVGRPLPEVSLKIALDGEILVKSRKLFKGYFKNAAETEAALEGGWFHTGDVGQLDADGYLRITDRKKDLIVTSGGRNIAPQKIESLAKADKLITQFVVHGDRRNYLTALVTLDREKAIRYANENRILFSEYSELIRHPKILSLVQKLIDSVNQDLASFETIKKFIILPNEFSIETGELTPSLKVKRGFVSDRYQGILDQMYAP